MGALGEGGSCYGMVFSDGFSKLTFWKTEDVG